MIRSFFVSRIHSFRYAFAGLLYVIRTQKNAWLHAIATILVLVSAIYLHLAWIEVAILILTIGLVWTAEFINTALEAIVDLASPQNHPLARVGKDVGAAAVLIAAISAFTIGLIIFIPSLISLFTR